jgi:hypothetical protein
VTGERVTTQSIPWALHLYLSLVRLAAGRKDTAVFILLVSQGSPSFSSVNSRNLGA